MNTNFFENEKKFPMKKKEEVGQQIVQKIRASTSMLKLQHFTKIESKRKRRWVP